MPEDSSPSDIAKPGKAQVFVRRLGSTLALWGIVAFAFWKAWPVLFFVMLSALALAALVEYFGLFRHEPGRRRFRWHVYVVGFAYLAVLFAPMFGIEAEWLRGAEVVAIALLLIAIVFSRLRESLEGMKTFDEIATAVFGFVYVVVLFGFTAKILRMPELVDTEGNPSSHFYVLYLLAVTKFTDMGAYAIGSLIGKHKMVPKVSPGKTWQGFGGALFSALVASFGCLWIFGAKIPLITPPGAAGLAIGLGLAAVLGDLAESILKRSTDVKDSGHGLPGIGGILDLIDSVLFTAPLLYFYLLLVSSSAPS